METRGAAATIGAGLNLAMATFRRRILGQRFLERPVHGYRMLLDLDDRGISRTLLLFGSRELEHKIMLERVLKPGMTVLDIGANIGYYALMELALIGPRGRLVAVEPSPANVALLKRNLALNGYANVEVRQAAVSDRLGARSFFLSHMSNLNTFHADGTGAAHLSGETIDVETVTVPALMAGRAPDLIRMDVEGHEVEIINGLIPAVERGEMAPMILFETHLSRYGKDHDMERPLRRLFDLGYRTRLAASSSRRGTAALEARGYRGGAEIATDDVTRVIFEDISAGDSVGLICRAGGLRTVLLSR
jgi:FkbM family methyltransferase